ncbi:hypothetical protein [Rhodanobacter lindaniclasticus]
MPSTGSLNASMKASNQRKIMGGARGGGTGSVDAARRRRKRRSRRRGIGWTVRYGFFRSSLPHAWSRSDRETSKTTKMAMMAAHMGTLLADGGNDDQG